MRRAASAHAAGKADRIFINGQIWTGDPAQPRAEALAVRGTTIMAIGATVLGGQDPYRAKEC